MKPFTYFLLFALIFGCKNSVDQKPISSETEKTVEAIQQWLTWDGNGSMPHVVLVSGDEEYRSEEALPMLAKILSERHGFKCTVLFAQHPENPGVVDPNYTNNIPGLEQLASADLMILFTRFRALPDEQMKHVDDYLKSGKPVIGIRTATHAFMFEEAPFESAYKHYGNYYKGDDEWKDGFGRLVMGEHWVNHHGKHGDQSTTGLIASGANNHPLVNGIKDGGIWGPTDVYGVRLPLPGDAQPIILGQVTERENERDDNDPLLGMRSIDNKLPGIVTKKEDGKEIAFNQNDPMMPIVWTKSYQLPEGEKGKCLSTTIGSSTDMMNEGVRRLIVNGVFWGLDLTVPEQADVAIVGTYQPSKFAFHKDEHWDKKNMIISDLK